MTYPGHVELAQACTYVSATHTAFDRDTRMRMAAMENGCWSSVKAEKKYPAHHKSRVNVENHLNQKETVVGSMHRTKWQCFGNVREWLGDHF